MKFKAALKAALVIIILCQSVMAGRIMHDFSLWGIAETTSEKIFLYWGFTNGFFLMRGGTAPQERKHFTQLAACLYEKMDYKQAAAMIDKYYRDHPEKWGNDLGEQMVNALTVPGGPCESFGF
jgi:hypothetical protein